MPQSSARRRRPLPAAEPAPERLKRETGRPTLVAAPAPEPVSVVIATYNRAALVGRAIESVLRATRRGDEILVVDDGSSDDTAARVARFGNRVRYLALPHRGCGAARNAGLLAATHDLVALLDSDDAWREDRLTLQRPIMAAHPELAFCCSNFGQVLPDERRVPSTLVSWHRDRRSWDEILGPGRWYSTISELPPGRADFRVHIGSLYPNQLHGNYVSINTLLVRRSVVQGGFVFDEDLPTRVDCAGFARLSRLGDCAYLDCDTAWQYTHDGPRLSRASELRIAEAWLTIIARNWASDPEFVRTRGDELRQVVASWRRRRARELILLGRRQEAQAELQGLPASVAERLALRLPPALVRAAVSLRRAAAGWLARRAAGPVERTGEAAPRHG